MIFMFISSLSLFFKWQRLIFILISLEFIVMSLFIYFSTVLNEMMFFYFMCFSVISSVLGMIVMVGNMKFYGSDQCLF
uniref:NADH dehydrogenase subunit 4L n=4 Tax=Anisakis simplex complex TaxID=644710 RepID=Q1X6K2_ANISI|nr:NADH dehydrogenase subunit 4L [Anisakis berlandi]YP_009355301.1 NADH dehydrogenase subunit 4L [Anisakis pegreffii]YP_537101.1 NADH dehydrogenase subunit 4L [Anisakis simplex]AAY43175.1 NADH dehydrogenase subunit 4L [Anisakis simplex]AES86030.1 NADH dehydrogenase subunit 4L [Anisakis berlandi]AES86042.1 NADH dehydrogenase subunit 4L [Anisakis simplex]AES86054.1 NADH dehydrogenase subunit 4L [Anisakis simplex]AES86066.1 NADH dehydrogenase subunit 4L [Anisakis simplex]